MGNFVSYLRVSTQRQGKSGLGLQAQREAVRGYLGADATLLEEFVETESGRHSARPKLARALALCRLQQARLIVAKIDRLARNVAFISALMESGVKFVAVDLPEANELVVHIMSAMAEHEAKAISERTRAALAVVKTRKGLGVRSHKDPAATRAKLAAVADQGRQVAIRVRRAKQQRHTRDILPIMRDLQQAGKNTLSAIAEALNKKGLKTPHGKKWSAMQVSRVLKSAEAQ
jgi:DNA invertase Pin-like site-specific DNA recombinase